MNKQGRNLWLDICDYRKNCVCNVYDSSQDLSGQATDVITRTERNGWKELSFVLPSTCESEEGQEENYRIQYLIADYKLRLVDDYETDWYLISEPKVTHNQFSKNIDVTATHISQLLKTKNLGLEFSDSEGNNVGTAKDLLTTILDGTGWYVGEVAEFLEEDTAEPTVKIRSLEAPAKTGAFRLIEMLCEKFDAKPVYHGESYVLLDEDPGDLDTNYSAYCKLVGDGSRTKPSGPSKYIAGKYYPFEQLTEPAEYQEGIYYRYKVMSVDIMPMNPFSEDLEDGEIPNLVVSGDRKAIELHYDKNLKDITRTLNTENIVTKLYAYGSYGDLNGACSVQIAYHEEYQFVLTRDFPAGTEFRIKDDYGAIRYFTATDELHAQDLLIWSKLDFASRSYVWNDSTKKAYSITKEPQGTYKLLSDFSGFNYTDYTVTKNAETITEIYPEPRELTEEEQIMAQFSTDEAYVEYMKEHSEVYQGANTDRKRAIEKNWIIQWNSYYVSTLPTRIYTTLHSFFFTDSQGAAHYFNTEEDLVEGMKLTWIQSEAKFINNTTGTEYPTTTEAPEEYANLSEYITEDFVEDKSFSFAVKNYFPALFNFDYYEQIGLLDDEMKQAIATYQRAMPGYYKTAEQAAKDLADGLTELSMLADSQTGFLRLAIKPIDTESGYQENDDLSVTMYIDTDQGDNGVVYRSDYLESKRNYFEWHVAQQLKVNGEPTSGSPSALLIVHDTTPVTWERVYLKKIDDRLTTDGRNADYDYGLNMGDEPKSITLWATLASHERGTIPNYQPGDRFYLFCTVSTSGTLGALQYQDWAIENTQITTATAVSTEVHPFYFVDNRWETEQGDPVAPPLSVAGVYGQYGWYYRYYPVEDRAGDLFFCGEKDTEWHPVYLQEEAPSSGDEGSYFFNTKLRTLWVRADSVWVEMESAAERRIATCFSQVYYLCRRRDQIYKGLYEKYCYTVTTSSLPIGRYLIDSGYDYQWAFTTDRVIPVGSTIYVDTLHNYVYQDNDVNNVVKASVVGQYVIKPMESNILTADRFAEGWLDGSDGHETSHEGANEVRSPFIEVYPGSGYETNLPSASLVIFYDEAKNFRGMWQPKDNSTFIVPQQTSEDYDAEKYKPDARYIRIALPLQYEIDLGETNGMTKDQWRAANQETAAWLDANGFELLVHDVYHTSTNTTTAHFYTVNTHVVDDYYVRIQGYETKAYINDNYRLPYTLLTDTHVDGELKGLNNLTLKFAELADAVYGRYLVRLRNAQNAITEQDNLLMNLLGEMLREGYWQEQDYVEGDEDKLYRDALDNLKEIAHPDATYNISYLDLYGANRGLEFSVDGNDYEWPDIQITDAIHLVDPEIDVNCWAYIDKIEKCYDQPWKTNIEINTKLSTIGQHDFTDVMTRIAEVAKTAKSKQALLERINEITNEDGYVYASKLIGEWEAKLKATESSWYTDRHGNIVFEAADGSSAMMLTGAGYCISNQKDEWGDWVYTTMATGDGIAAEKIVAGYLNVERIENHSITTEKVKSFFGADLDISANKALTLFATADGTKPAGGVRTGDSMVQIVSGNAERKAQVNIASGGEINLTAGAYGNNFYLLKNKPADFDTHYGNYYKFDGKEYVQLTEPADFDEGVFYTMNQAGDLVGGTINVRSGGEINLESQGAFNIKSGGNLTVDAGGSIDIKSDGIFTINSNNFKIFYDEENQEYAVEVKGRIQADSGNIAGFSIEEGYLQYVYSNGQVYLGIDKIVIGNAEKHEVDQNISFTGKGFYADRNGNAYMSGTIDANNGEIAGWRIESTFIGGGDLDTGSSSSSLNYKVGLSSSANVASNIVFWAGREYDVQHSTVSDAFTIQADGTVTINKGSIHIKHDGTEVFSVTNEGYLTAEYGKVGGWTIGSDYIGSSSTKALSKVGMASSTTDADVVFWAGRTNTSDSFKVYADGKLSASNVEITGGSIQITNNNTVAFQVTNTGALTATSGTVGGWYIGSNYIGNNSSRDTSTVGMVSAVGTDGVFWAGGVYTGVPPFYVTASGYVHASNINIAGGQLTIGSTFSVSNTGVITASSGTIGGWTISSTHIGNNASLDNATLGMVAATSGNIVFWAGGAHNNVASIPFYVTSNGYLKATDASISGTLTAGNNSTIGGWTVNGTKLYGTMVTDGVTYTTTLDPNANRIFSINDGSTGMISPWRMSIMRNGDISTQGDINTQGDLSCVGLTLNSYKIRSIDLQSSGTSGVMDALQSAWGSDIDTNGVYFGDYGAAVAIFGVRTGANNGVFICIDRRTSQTAITVVRNNSGTWTSV